MRGHQDDMTTPFRILAISQGRVERFMVDAMEDLSASKMQVERGVVAESFLYDDAQENDSDGYPIELVLRTLSDSEANPPTPPGALGGRDNIAQANLPPDETPPHMWNPRTAPGTLETLQAKYLIGCDGAHSWLRQQLNYKTEGAHTPSVWYVAHV
jgi:phenol 2-monooxygenase